MRPRSKRWQRDRIVAGTLWTSVVASTNTTCAGGSSSVLRKASQAAAVATDKVAAAHLRARPIHSAKRGGHAVGVLREVLERHAPLRVAAALAADRPLQHRLDLDL